MDSRAALLAAIADRPDDDTPRLAYADWLEDHAADLPDPAAARARSDFIRVQCAVKQLEHLPSAEMQGYADLYRRQDFLLTHHRADLLGPLAAALGPFDVTFDRGFVSELRLDAAAFDAHAEEIARLTPRPEVVVAGGRLSLARDGSPLIGLVTALRWVTHVGLPRGNVWRGLRVLNVSGCGVYDLDLERLDPAEFPAVTDLDASFNGISDAGVRVLTASPLWPRLRVLNLQGNPIGDDGAFALADAPPAGLAYLNVSRTGITRAGQQRLLRRTGWKVDLF